MVKYLIECDLPIPTLNVVKKNQMMPIVAPSSYCASVLNKKMKYIL